MNDLMCAVVTDATSTVEELMAPYCIHCSIDVFQDEYENSTLRFAYDPDNFFGPVLYPLWDSKPIPSGMCMTSDIPMSMIYDTFERYMGQTHPNAPIEEITLNPTGKWKTYEEVVGFHRHIGRVPAMIRDIRSTLYPLFSACITPDGEWHDIDGYVACDDLNMTIDAYVKWASDFDDKYIRPYPDCILHVVKYGTEQRDDVA